MISYFQEDIIEISYFLQFCLIMRYTHTLLSLHWAPTSHWCQTWPQVPIISWALLGTNRKVGIWLSAHPISATKSHLKLQQQLQGSHSSQAVSLPCTQSCPQLWFHSSTQQLLTPWAARCCHCREGQSWAQMLQGLSQLPKQMALMNSRQSEAKAKQQPTCEF